MEEFIRYAQKVLPHPTSIGTYKVLKWFDNYKYSQVYFANDDNVVADIHLSYFGDRAEDEYDKTQKQLLKLSGAKAYLIFEESGGPLWDDIKQTTPKCGISVADAAITSSKRMNIAFVYKSLIASVSASADKAILIAHKVLMNLIVTPYTHFGSDVQKLIEQFETSHLLSPAVCQSCLRPSETIVRNLKVCSRCMRARYCDVDCQKKDWKSHKHVCSCSPQ